jgi:hypothetical protein
LGNPVRKLLPALFARQFRLKVCQIPWKIRYLSAGPAVKSALEGVSRPPHEKGSSSFHSFLFAGARMLDARARRRDAHLPRPLA